MRFVDENGRTMRFRDGDELFQSAEIAVHRVNAFDHDQSAFAFMSA
jgi:hypothetical protein